MWLVFCVRNVFDEMFLGFIGVEVVGIVEEGVFEVVEFCLGFLGGVGYFVDE